MKIPGKDQGSKINLLIRNLLERIELLTGYFFVFRLRSIRTGRVLSHYDEYPEYSGNIAVLMQGPVIKRADFTYETLRLYRKVYPSVRIILSTWSDTDKSVLEKIASLNVTVLKNTIPDFGGHSNINFQLKSTLTGIKYLKDFKIDYVLKTRTDQRIYSTSDYLGYLIKMLDTFPVKSKFIEKRLAVCSLNMFRKRKYCVSDMFMFGTFKDISLFWDIPFQNEMLTEDRDREFYENNLAEAYLINNYFRSINFTPLNTYPDSDKFIRSNFFIVDRNTIDLFWYKYNHNFERTRMEVDGKQDRPYSVLDWFPHDLDHKY